MEQWVLEILKNEREKRKLPLEVKKLNNNLLPLSLNDKMG